MNTIIVICAILLVAFAVYGTVKKARGRALSRLLAGKTVLVIAHRMRTVEAADKIVVLDQGVVAEQGSPAELLGKEDGLFRRMTQLQAASASYRI